FRLSSAWVRSLPTQHVNVDSPPNQSPHGASQAPTGSDIPGAPNENDGEVAVRYRLFVVRGLGAGDHARRTRAKTEELDPAGDEDLRTGAVGRDHGQAPRARQRHLPRSASGAGQGVHDVCWFLSGAHW